MDKELKIAISLFLFLAMVSALLLQILAGVHVFSKAFLLGFLPFVMLLFPYVLFSSKWFVTLIRDWTYLETAKKLLFPAYILLVYVLSTVFLQRPDWMLFSKLGLWLVIPTLIFSIGYLDKSRIAFKELIVIFWLWLPVEFGRLSGFDITLTNDLKLPAMPLASVGFGLYLFAVLRDLPGIGYTFAIKLKDFLAALFGLCILGVLLVPLGTHLGFIRYSTLDVSPTRAVELILGIYFLVAIPEELLFRGIIQNITSQLLGGFYVGRWIALLIASVIFGFSHWNNFNPMDWRYVFLASIAGIVYGYTYLKTGKTTVSALVHCGVNFIWAVLFKESGG